MTMPAPTTYTTPLPVHFETPLVNPSPGGLYPATQWTEEGDGPTRWLSGGVEVRGGNYSDGQASGIWDAPWCEPPALDGPRKEGERQTILDIFEPVTVWAYDECDLTAPSRAEVRQRAAQILRLEEAVAVEREFAARLLLDAADLGATPTVADVIAAVAALEAAMAKTNTLGYFHLGMQWAARLASAHLLVRTGTGFTTPTGHRLILGGGYVEGLADTIVATSQPFGWRSSVQVREAVDERHNTYAAIAERSVVVGYEALIAAVTITPPDPTP
ncbi:hypothetical protein [Mycobacterium persicum]|uniref:hypothetical protein n=1 Tax=Mycobacterium persicum TaxID=1487726 RepID=UPI0009F47CE3|nr:hypothetical protein [Mycobacterium persicum]ORB32797.1 hypothetical protein BST40_27510 [Mycobacterium persicum]